MFLFIETVNLKGHYDTAFYWIKIDGSNDAYTMNQVYGQGGGSMHWEMIKRLEEISSFTFVTKDDSGVQGSQCAVPGKAGFW